jgi:hypothetical protein
MGERRALVIGSQCRALGKSSLSFLPRAAQDLAAVLLDPERGRCAPALRDGTSLLLDPSLGALDDAIEEAVTRGSADEATLFVAFVGHGEHAEHDDFYLLAYDSSNLPTSKVAFLIAQRLRELLREHDRLDGLVLLVDACHSGVGVVQAAATWPRTVSEAGGRFEVLTAANDREAYDGCFTRTLTELIQHGQPQLGESLRPADLRSLVQLACTKQTATYLAFDGRNFTPLGDEGLWLARNHARRRSATTPLAQTLAWGQVERLTAWFQRTPQLDQLVDAARTSRLLAVVGPAGQGKSTLAAALVRAELADDLLPSRFTHGLLFMTPASSPGDLARALSVQFTLTVDGFPDAATRFRAQTSDEVWASLDPWERGILGPLRLLAHDQVVRAVIDGLDQLTAQAGTSVHTWLETLLGDPTLARARLVITARPDTPLPRGTRRLTLGRVDDIYLESYLRRRRIPDPTITALVRQAEGNWLVARVLADLAAEGAVPAAGLPTTLEAAYEQDLQRAGLDDPDTWTQQLRPVLAILTVAGVGPVLPLPLLCNASGRLGGPNKAARVRDVLVRLRGLVVRGNPGANPHEQIGLFHTTLVEFLSNNPRLGIDRVAAHAALGDAIAELAPTDSLSTDDPLYRYAAATEAEHLWQAGRVQEVLASLQSRELIAPAENRARWAAWLPRIREVFGPEDLATLVARHQIAYYTVAIGNFTEALRLYREVLTDSERILGHDHPETFAARDDIAGTIGQTGNFTEALRLYHEVLTDRERILGHDHPDTLATRQSIGALEG